MSYGGNAISINPLETRSQPLHQLKPLHQPLHQLKCHPWMSDILSSDPECQQPKWFKPPATQEPCNVSALLNVAAVHIQCCVSSAPLHSTPSHIWALLYFCMMVRNEHYSGTFCSIGTPRAFKPQTSQKMSSSKTFLSQAYFKFCTESLAPLIVSLIQRLQMSFV